MRSPTAQLHVSKSPQTTMHLKADCQAPTWSTTTRDTHFAEARCATRGTGCLPIDSFLPIDSSALDTFRHWISRGKHRKWAGLTALSGSPTQTGDTEEHACNRRTKEDNNRAYKISIHLKIDNNREYSTSIHQDMLEIDTTHPEYCLSEGNTIQQSYR